jgi:hypothetical protein
MEPGWFVSDSTGATKSRTKSSILSCRGRCVLYCRGRRLLSCRGRRVLSCRGRRVVSCSVVSCRVLSCRGRPACPVVVVPPVPLVTELRVRSLTANVCSRTYLQTHVQEHNLDFPLTRTSMTEGGEYFIHLCLSRKHGTRDIKLVLWCTFYDVLFV